MYTKNVLAVAGLVSLVAAVPLQHHQADKRDVVWVTATQDTYVTMAATTTVWLQPGETAPAAAPQGSPFDGHFGHFGHGHIHKHKGKPTSTVHVQSTVTVQQATPPAAETPTSTEEASTMTPAEETPVSTPTYVAPTTTAAATPSTTSEAPAASSSSSSGSSSPPSGADLYNGEITYYAPGLGSCGTTSSSTDMIVALSYELMTTTGNPNDDPLCGKTITLSHGGTTVEATVVDTCPGCTTTHVDLSPAVFQKFAPLSVGVVQGVEWWLS